jgi:plastocyanin
MPIDRTLTHAFARVAGRVMPASLAKAALARFATCAKPAIGAGVVIVFLASSAAPALGASTVTVDVAPGSLSFSQANVSINPGDTIHWVWDSSGHSVTSGTGPAGDGSFDAGVQSAGFTFDRTFTQPGVYHYFCKIHYAFGMMGTITVAAATPPRGPPPTAQPPTAQLTVSPQRPTTGQSVTFDGSGSSATAGQTIASYHWDFGDGSASTTAAPTVTHRYAHAGSDTVKLVVFDGLGTTSGPASATVNVGLPPPQPPVATKPHLGASTLCARKTKTCAHASTSVSFSLSRAATATVVVGRGRHQVRRRTVHGKAGQNSFKLSAAGLPAGTYKIVLTPSGGKAVTAGFRVRKA